MMLILGDAIAVALLKIRGFNYEDFKKFHPGGNIGRDLKKVSEISVGDTMTIKTDLADKALPGYTPIKPMVFSGMYPIDSNDYDNLRLSLE